MPGPNLNDLRGEIDRLDDELIALLTRRARLAADVAPLKAGLGTPMLRPGREAEVLRRLVGKAGNGFDPLTVVRIWREIMSAALRVQGRFSVSVCAPEGVATCWSLARGQYGTSTPMIGASGPAQAIAAVAEGKADVAVVPFPAVEDTDPWWRVLLGNAAPRVVARLPVAEGMEPEVGVAAGLAVAAMIPEESGDDRSLIAIEVAESPSRAAIAAACRDAGLILRHSAGLGGGGTSFVVEVDGFLKPDDPALDRLRTALGDNVRDTVVIGAYAVPLRLKAAAGS
ncbi:MAG: chorismate mutase [Alphaproteobacteria bacterium]